MSFYGDALIFDYYCDYDNLGVILSSHNTGSFVSQKAIGSLNIRMWSYRLALVKLKESHNLPVLDFCHFDKISEKISLEE